MDLKKCDACGKIIPKEQFRHEVTVYAFAPPEKGKKPPNIRRGKRFDVCAECISGILERLGMTEENMEDFETEDEYAW